VVRKRTTKITKITKTTKAAKESSRFVVLVTAICCLPDAER